MNLFRKNLRLNQPIFGEGEIIRFILDGKVEPGKIFGKPFSVTEPGHYRYRVDFYHVEMKGRTYDCPHHAIQRVKP